MVENDTFSLPGFAGRDEELKKVKRYLGLDQLPYMLYRTDLYVHSRRVYLLLEDFLPEVIKVYDAFDPDKALALALVHDDAEIVSGDVALYHKDRMTAEQLAEVDRQEAEAIEVLANRWSGKVRGYDYRELMLHALSKDCLEAQVVSYADKLEACCECLHEVRAGNQAYIRPAWDYIVNQLGNFTKKFPALAKLLPGDHFLLRLPTIEEMVKVSAWPGKHTSTSIKERTGSPHYDRWKELTIEHLGEKYLLEVKEKPIR